VEERTVEASTVFEKIFDSKKRIIVNEGSARSTKTYSIIQYIIIEHLNNPGLRTTISRARLTWAKSSVMVDFLDILDKYFKIYNPNDWNKSESIYKLNGGEVSFIGLDEVQKVHGRKQDIFWINEAVEADYKDFEQLVIRTTRRAILDYNPSFEQHWIYDKVIPRDDCDFIKSTYKDNPFLEPEIVKEIERLEPTAENIAQGTADSTSWKIYGLGERAAHKGLIFSKVQLCKEFPPKDEWKRRFYGLDFGFTNDPSCLSEIVYAHGNLYMKELFYKRGLTNIGARDSIQSELKNLGIGFQESIWSDAAEPKSIKELNNCGWYNLRAADKGPDSIKSGIDTILRYPCFLLDSSLNAVKEKNNYKWKENSSGESTNVPIDNFNHFWDATRYAVLMEMRKSMHNYKPMAGHSGVVF